MSTKPGVFALSKSATQFTFSNVGLFFNHIKYLLPLLIACGLVKQVALMEKVVWLQPVMSVATLFLYACFALAWHRSSLQGPDEAHERNPINLRGGDWGFIWVFCALSGVFGLSMQGLGYLSEQVFPSYGAGISLIGNIAVIALILIAIVMFLRASFIFPARSVGVKLGWVDAKRASKGLVWPLLGANIIFGLLFVVAFSVYAFVAGFVTTVAAGSSEMNRVELIAVGVIVAVPILMAAFFFVALCVAALSRAYQWGIQNNDIIPDAPLKRVD